MENFVSRNSNIGRKDLETQVIDKFGFKIPKNELGIII